MNKDIIDLAVDKKYTDFSNAIKAELHNKMAAHPTSVNYANEYDNIEHMKSIFSEINQFAKE